MPHLRRLGHGDVRRVGRPLPSGIGPAGRGVLAQVVPSAPAVSPRDVECLWLTAMTESAARLCFSAAKHSEEARIRADAPDVPLFLLDPTGVPRPVNGPAGAPHADGA